MQEYKCTVFAGQIKEEDHGDPLMPVNPNAN
jgi:hypothetical protein